MSIEPLEDRQLLSAVPPTLYVATSFFDQLADAQISTPNVGDAVNFLPSGQFGEVDNLTFGTNAFTSIQAAVTAAATGDVIEVAAGEYEESLTINQPLTLVGAVSSTADLVTLAAPTADTGTGITINASGGSVSIQNLVGSGFATGLVVDAGSNVALANATITNNDDQGGAGGGINNAGTLTIVSSTISHSSANQGGGIYNSGTLTVNDSTVADNSANSGAGIENVAGATLTLENSTLSANTAISGTGAAGVDNLGTAYVANTIIGANDSKHADPDVRGVFASTDHDLIGVLGDATGFTTTGPTASIIVNSSTAAAVGLAPLASYGGLTQTMSLMASPGLGAGDPTPPAPFSVPATDQRGQPRLTNGVLDIGAVQAPQQVYVATSFYDQTLAQVTWIPSLGDIVNWVGGGQFTPVNGLVFGANAFASIPAGVESVAIGGTVDVETGNYSQPVAITHPLTLLGAQSATADLTTISGSGVGAGITVNAKGAVNIQGFNISGFATGVAVDAGSDATLADDTIFANSNRGGFGGGINNAGTLTVTASTIANNSAQEGAGIWNASAGTLTVADTTIAGNIGSAGIGMTSDGGGIASEGPLTVISSTISGNTATLAGGVEALSGTADVANTIIAGNSAANDADVRGIFAATDHDLTGSLGDATGFATSGATGSIVLGSDSASAIGLGPLAGNGGPTQTMALLVGSPAVGAGDATPGSPFGVPTTDQRGLPRVTNGKLDIGAYQTQRAQEYVATSFYDHTTGQTTSSPSAGDIVNWPASGSFSEVDGLVFGTNAFTSVQAAVTASASGDVIDVAAGTYSETVVITLPVSLIGAGPQTVLQVPSTTTATVGVTINTTAGTTSIEGLTITQFSTGVSVASAAIATLIGDTLIGRQVAGGGIVNQGTLTLSDSSVTNYIAGPGGGGGIANLGTMTVIASTIEGNLSPGNGGGISDSGMLTVTDSTIANNQTGISGGGIYAIANGGRGKLILENSTLSGNSTQSGGSGGGVFNGGAMAYVANTIIAGNSATTDPDVHGLFNSTDHNLIGVVGAATGFSTTGATASIVLGSDSASAIGLGPLANNGGPTQTMALMTGSPAIDSGDPIPPSPWNVPATDQLGQPRTFNGTVDVGAYETAPTTLYVATSFYDQTTGATTSTPNTGDTVNWPASGSFAEVDGLVFGTNAFTSIQAAASTPGRTIDVAAGTYNESVTITHPVSLVGAGPQTVLQAPSTGSVGFTIDTTAGTTTIADFTITQFGTGVSVAKAAAAALTGDTLIGVLAAGGGIVNDGTLTLSDSSITNYAGTNGGGGISNLGTTTVIASTISGNIGGAGGIYNSGTITVENATIAGNEALNAGGGIYNLTQGTLILENSTVSGNTAPGVNGGGINNAGTAYVANTIIAGNSASIDPDVHGAFALTDHNLIGELGSATGFTTTGPTASIILGTDSAPAIGLGPLTNNGGPTQTMALLAGSRAVDAGDDSPPAPFSVPGIDQRGMTRITALDPAVDIGAYEVTRPAVTSFVVEKGLAERSYIRYLDVTFNVPVAGLTLDLAHVKLEHFALDGVTLLGDIDLTNKISLIDKVMEIDFGAGGIGGQENLAALLANWTKLTADDGYYTLVIDPDGTGLHDVHLDFDRLFGDVIGNPTGGATTTGSSLSGSLTYGVPTVIGQVTTADVDSIGAAVGQTGSLLNDDINGAGSVTPNDRLLAAKSVGRQLAAGLHLDD